MIAASRHAPGGLLRSTGFIADGGGPDGLCSMNRAILAVASVPALWGPLRHVPVRSALANLECLPRLTHAFPAQELLFILMLLPLVIPAVIPGDLDPDFAAAIANYFTSRTNIMLDTLRPGLLLWCRAICILTYHCHAGISARLAHFHPNWKEAALQSGASP